MKKTSFFHKRPFNLGSSTMLVYIYRPHEGEGKGEGGDFTMKITSRSAPALASKRRISEKPSWMVARLCAHRC